MPLALLALLPMLVLLAAGAHAGIFGARRSPRTLAWISAASSLVALGCTLVLWPRVASSQRLDLAYVTVVAGLSFDFAIDALGVAFAAAILALAVVTFSSMALDPAPSRAPARLHTAAFALLLGGVTACFAGNLLLLYAGLEVVNFAAFMLFTCGSRLRARRAARWAFGTHAAGLGLLAAALWVAHLTGTAAVAAVPIEAYAPGVLALALGAGVVRIASPATLAWAPIAADRAAGERGTRGILVLGLGAGSLATGLYLVARLMTLVQGVLPHPVLAAGMIGTGLALAAAASWVAWSALSVEGLAGGALLGEAGLALAAWGLPASLAAYAALLATAQAFWIAVVWLVLADRRSSMRPKLGLATLVVGLTAGLPIGPGFLARLFAVQAALASGGLYDAAAAGVVAVSVLSGAAILGNGRRLLGAGRALTPASAPVERLMLGVSLAWVAVAAVPQWGLAALRPAAVVARRSAATAVSFGALDVRAVAGAWPAGSVVLLVAAGALCALAASRLRALKRIRPRFQPQALGAESLPRAFSLPRLNWPWGLYEPAARFPFRLVSWSLAAVFVYLLLRQ